MTLGAIASLYGLRHAGGAPGRLWLCLRWRQRAGWLRSSRFLGVLARDRCGWVAAFRGFGNRRPSGVPWCIRLRPLLDKRLPSFRQEGLS
jgi:hypothetical protein